MGGGRGGAERGVTAKKDTRWWLEKWDRLRGDGGGGGGWHGALRQEEADALGVGRRREGEGMDG